MDIIIRLVQLDDADKVSQFFSMQVKNTFHVNNLFGEDGIKSEVECKHQQLYKAISDNYPNNKQYIAQMGDEIVGVGGCSEANSLITDCDKNANIVIGSVYVDKAYRRNGVASSIINIICAELKDRGETHFFLDSGYKIAQSIWQNKFGEPTYTLKDYWDAGYHHMVWKVEL